MSRDLPTDMVAPFTALQSVVETGEVPTDRSRISTLLRWIFEDADTSHLPVSHRIDAQLKAIIRERIDDHFRSRRTEVYAMYNAIVDLCRMFYHDRITVGDSPRIYQRIGVTDDLLKDADRCGETFEKFGEWFSDIKGLLVQIDLPKRQTWNEDGKRRLFVYLYCRLLVGPLYVPKLLDSLLDLQWRDLDLAHCLMTLPGWRDHRWCVPVPRDIADRLYPQARRLGAKGQDELVFGGLNRKSARAAVEGQINAFRSRRFAESRRLPLRGIESVGQAIWSATIGWPFQVNAMLTKDSHKNAAQQSCEAILYGHAHSNAPPVLPDRSHDQQVALRSAAHEKAERLLDKNASAADMNDVFRGLLSELGQIPVKPSTADLKWESADFRKRVEETLLPTADPTSEAIALMARWAAARLRSIAPDALASEMAILRPWIIQFADGVRLQDKTLDDWQELTATLFQAYAGDLRKLPVDFVSFLQAEFPHAAIAEFEAKDVASGSWCAKHHISAPQELIGPLEVRAVLQHFSGITSDRRRSDHDRRMARIRWWFVVLAYGAGLRLHEIVLMRQGNIIVAPNGGVTLRVFLSKSEAGRLRPIPLHLTLPPALWRACRPALLNPPASGDPDRSIWPGLFDCKPHELTTADERRVKHRIAEPIRLQLQRVCGRRVRFHDLRHSFATETVIRLTELYTGESLDRHLMALAKRRKWPTYMAPPIATSQEQRLVAVWRPVPIDRVHQLITVWGTREEAAEQVRRELWAVVARLMGHADPLTTSNTYCHAFDLVASLLEHWWQEQGDIPHPFR